MPLLRHLLLFSLLYSTKILSQNHLNYGKVFSDKDFSCNTGQIKKEGTTNTNPVFSTGLKTICESENELEIRCYNEESLAFGWQLFIITYNKGQWNAKEYWDNFGRKSYDSLHPIKSFNLIPMFGFDSLFKALRQNKIFILPDERKIKFEMDYDDPAFHVITYKVQNKFRRYRILYSDNYKEKYSKIKTFDYYDNLLNIFINQLYREE